MIDEIYKDIVGYEGIYQVSNFGNVRSLQRLTKRSDNVVRTIKEKQLALSKDGTGYNTVCLFNGKSGETKKVHQLVAQSFLNHNPCGFKLVVNHKDFNKQNNYIDNLEIITQRQNSNHKHLKSISKYTGVSWNKGVNKWIAYICIDGRQKNLGYYTNEDEASQVYLNALNKHLNL
jgi:hypothetical protein